VLGAALSGAIIENAVLRLDRKYSFALVVEAGLLLLAMVSLGHGFHNGHFFASAACGLQNGMVSTYSGAVVRTTHVSGLFTDLGTMFGARLRGHALDTRKALLYLLLIVGFILGGSLGAFSFQHLQSAALGIPAAGAFFLAVVCWVYRHMGKGGLGQQGPPPEGLASTAARQERSQAGCVDLMVRMDAQNQVCTADPTNAA
jgi:uncharacterized membrane protein YoaK (UPF0700 family)